MKVASREGAVAIESVYRYLDETFRVAAADDRTATSTSRTDVASAGAETT